jgi:uncharacterized membrane protein
MGHREKQTHKAVRDRRDRRDRREQLLLIATVAAMAILSISFYASARSAVPMFINLYGASLRYPKAIVLEADNSALELPEYGGERMFGSQMLTVRILEGEYAGMAVNAENIIMSDNYVFPDVGDKVVLSVDKRTEDGPPYCILYSFDRTPGIGFIVALFAVALMAVGRQKGVRALLGLLFTFAMIIFFVLPRIYFGDSPVLLSVATCAVTSAFSLALLNGYNEKTLSSVLAVFSGLCFAGLFFSIYSALARLSGYDAPQVAVLSYFSPQTGLQIRTMLFAGVLISSLGAIMDVAVSITSAVFEVHRVNESLSVRQLFASGMVVAKDAIGTMSNTLVLAFAGGGLSSLVAMLGYGVQFNHIINSNTIAIEIGQGLTGTIALIATAPLSSLLASLLVLRKKNRGAAGGLGSPADGR